MYKKQGFTLIELLVVVLIIGILAAVALPQYEKVIEKSRATQGITLIKSLIDAQKVYYMANGTYATKFEDLDISLPNNATGSEVVIKDFAIKMHDMNTAKGHLQAMYDRRDMANTWYILYYFSWDKLYCGAINNSPAGKVLCSSFNSQPEICPETSVLCYPI